MTDLSDIPTEQLVARLQELSSAPQQAQTEEVQKPEQQAPEASQPNLAQNLAFKAVNDYAPAIAKGISNAVDSTKMAARSLASLPMGATQLITDHSGNHEIPGSHYLMPDNKNISTNDISNSIANVQKDTNAERQSYDQNNGIGDNLLDNLTNPAYLGERASEIIPQALQAGFVGKILKPLQFAGEASPTLTKVIQGATNIGSGAGVGAAFGATQPQTADTIEGRDKARGEGAEGGAILGGALSSLVPAATSTYNYVGDRLSPLVQAAKRLQTVVGTDNVPNFIKSIEANSPTAEAIPGYKPTTAQLAENPGMAALERGSRSPASPLASEIGQQDVNNRTAVSNMFEGIAPENQTTVGPWGVAPGEAGDTAALKQQAAQLYNEANKKTSSKLSTASSAADEAENNAQQVSQQQAQNFPDEDTGDISSKLNDKLKPQYNNDRKTKNNMFSNIDPNGDVPIDPTKFVQAGEDALKNISSDYARKGATPGIMNELRAMVRRPSQDPEVQAQIEALSNDPATQAQLKQQFSEQLDKDYAPQISFKQLQEYRPVLSDEIQKARMSGDGLKAQVLGQMKSALESYTGDLATSSDPALSDASQRAQNAMSFYQNTFAPKWKNGPGQQFAKGINTFNPIAPETVGSKFIRPGNVGASTLRNLNEMVKDDPTIQPIIEEHVLGDLQQQKGLVDDNGIIDPNKINSWMQKNNQTLKMNPELNGKITNMRDSVGTANEASDDMAQALKQRQQTFSEQQKSLNDSALQKILNVENTSSAIGSALNSDTPGKNVRSLVNIAKQDDSGRALKGLQQATYDHLKEELTNTQGRATQDATLPLSMAKLDTYLDNPAKTNALKMIIGDDGLSRLTAAKKGLQLMNTMSNFQSIPGSATSLNAAAEGLTKRMFKSAIDMATGGQSKIINLGILQADKALQGQVGQIMQKAVVDPEFAKTLVSYKPTQRFSTTNAAIKSGLPQAVIGEQAGKSEQQ